MQNYKLFIRSMRVMGKKRFVYLGSIFVMSVTFALFGIMSSLLMKCVVDIAQTGEYERLGYSIAAHRGSRCHIPVDLPCGNDPLQRGGQTSLW